MSPPTALSVILPASNEEAYLGACLGALLAGDPVPGGAEVIVVANGCRDRTAEIARDLAATAADAGWRLQVIERAEGDKIGALNAGDAAATGPVRAYLDADVTVSPPLMAALTRALLAAPGPAYASGRAVIPRPESAITRAYARLWQRLPFVSSVAPGYGLFAVNAAGRARWGTFPRIISDDTFVRLQFAPAERIGLPATYDWPMVEGWSRLVRVRRRQDAGVAEIAGRWPHLLENEGKAPFGPAAAARLALGDPVGFSVYAAVSVAVRMGRGRPAGWTRGR
ncbi:glycosyltransferase family 2 protein [Paracoccus marinaquae]|uniref:Glycosyltransferase family 2 protein n=1 Tax=Paracoccus marinaquae TaxID=2841926 RepID=A0ABS6AHA1_9RHOB|nr:glycosyltransferase family 2 protein [Paracoccus marinaquae]MBU3029971.1 glycosyltransferase family 2 protein [Paracoccus marinaquae]